MISPPSLQPQTFSGPIAWMTRNRVAANLLMLFLILGGLLVGSRVKQEVFPEFSVGKISISVIYPGASPAEVEQGIILALEDGVRGLDGVKEVTANAYEGRASVAVELLTGTNANKALQDVKNAVDRIQSLPEEAERPVVSLVELRNQVLTIMVYGDQDEQTLRNMAERVRDDLLQRPGITLVELAAARPLEIAIEVPQRYLRSYNLTLDRIAQEVRETAIELPAGGVKTAGGEILLRTQERRDFAREFADVPVASEPDGSTITVGDIATIMDGFEDTDEEAFYQGQRAIQVQVFRVGRETPQSVSDEVQVYIDEVQPDLPTGIALAVWDDNSEIYRDRVRLLLKNTVLGLSLVLLVLGLFLDPKLAFWVMLGIPISILGSFLFIPLTGASINMISLFAFIITLGIIVDDAIIVGENIYEKRQQGLPFLQAAIEGAQEIAGPVVFAVLTNIVAFMPLFFIPGTQGNFFRQIPSIVVAVFAVSLVESLIVLPAHLAHGGSPGLFWTIVGWPRLLFSKILQGIIAYVYQPLLRLALRNRYITVALSAALLILTAGAVGGGYVPFSFLPRVDADVVTVQATLPFGVPRDVSRQVLQQLVAAAQTTIARHGGPDIVRGMYTQIGSALKTGLAIGGDPAATGGSHLVGVQIALVPPEERAVGGVAFAKAWREATGAIVGLESLSFDAETGPSGGAAIDLQLSHRSRDTLEAAAIELASALTHYAGVTDIDDGVARGKPQMSFTLKPAARSLGLNATGLARQVRHAFYGAEALRQQRGRNELKVMVRLPASERQTYHTVEQMILRTAEGGEIALAEAAAIAPGRAYTEIKRREGRRIIAVTADVDKNVSNANTVIAALTATELPSLIRKYPGLSYTLEGEQASQKESLGALQVGGVLALLAIYSLLAIPFKSYMQPAIVMLSIPFGIIGAVAGHVLLGYELSLMSLFGIIALAGVVVNDSLVLVVTANELRDTGAAPFEAVFHASARRFRPIILTSLTTFFGLAPMIFETSVQARFLIPMAVSLGFGILFATGIVLIIIPSAYLILEDVKRLVQTVLSGAKPSEAS